MLMRFAYALIMVLNCLSGLMAHPSPPLTSPDPHRIYQQLCDYLDLPPAPVRPTLTIISTKTTGASFHSGLNRITLDRPLIDTVARLYDTQMQAAAIAFILGHELAHFVQEQRCHVPSLIETPVSTAPLSLTQKLEIEADYYASFALSLLEICPDTQVFSLQEIFHRYFSAYAIPLYPDPDSRTEAIEQARKRTKELLQIYRTATYLYVIGYTQSALEAFEDVSQEFVSHKVLNNMAACHLQLAIAKSPPERFPLAMPVEIDPLSRLEDGVRFPVDQDPEAVQGHLQEATSLLDICLKQFPGMISALTNAICLALMQKDLDRAKFLLDRYHREIYHIPTPWYRFQYYHLLALWHHHNHQPTQAQEYISRAQALAPNPSLAQVVVANQSVMAGQIPPIRDESDPFYRTSVDPEWHHVNKQAQATLRLSNGQEIRYRSKSEGIWWFVKNGPAFHRPFINVTRPIGTLPPQSTWKNIYQCLGSPSSQGWASSGYYAVYWGSGLILWFDPQGNLDHWVQFHSP